MYEANTLIVVDDVCYRVHAKIDMHELMRLLGVKAVGNVRKTSRAFSGVVKVRVAREDAP